jgi:uncharacterized protein (DUF1499 family)
MSKPLAPCPWPLICVCSRDDAAFYHRIDPLPVPGDPAAAFKRLKNLLEHTERTVIVTATDDYIHAECRSRSGYIDDLECRLCAAEKVIHVRSAARAWYALYDFGVNRARIEKLRHALEAG